jgi:hypothetical protein
LPILKKPFIKFASAIGLLVLLFAALLAWALSASLRGRLVARIDLRRGHFVFLTYGLEPPERSEIARLLRERYGIELRTVAGDIVSNNLVSYVSAYNEVMDATIRQTFGHDVYKECAEAAYKIGSAPAVAPSPKPIKDVYSVEDLVASRQAFAHTMVKVSGCFWSDVGSVIDNAESLLKQCGRAWPTPSDVHDQRVLDDYKDFYDHVISVENAERVHSMNWLKLHVRDPGDLEALKRLRIEELLFDYDKKRNSQAWQTLLKGRSLNDSLTDYGSEVVLLGQFETSSSHGYSTELILVDVLSNKATTTR